MNAEHDADVSTMIFDQAACAPGAVAVVENESRVRYGDFAARASRLARHLQAQGVGPDSLVAVVLDRSVDQLVAAVAVLAAGGAYVPLDPSYPTERLSFMLADTAATVLVTRSDVPVPFLQSEIRRVTLDSDAELIDGYPSTPPIHLAGPDHLAYVIYTSGSTGRPKGALNTRKGLASQFMWMQEAYRLAASDVVLQKTPVGFDVSLLECYWALSAGACTVVAGPGEHQDPGRLAELISEHGVTVSHFVPSMLAVFLDTADLSACNSLRQVIVSGEALPADLARRFFASGLRAELDNLYGPAEAAIHVTRWRCRRDWDESSVPIGWPVPGASVLVLDDRGEPARVGVEGELYLGGVQVGRGYLGQPVLTNERFVPDPYASNDGARMYRTGDRAKLRPDGALDFIGRLDDQVKIHGVRIELGEIEAALASQDGVDRCAVTVSRVRLQTSITAYVVGDADPGTIKARLAKMLPAPMVPTHIVQLDELPLSVNGKLDRNALLDPDVSIADGRANGKSSFMQSYRNESSADSEIIQEIIAIWGKVLDREDIAAESDFFEMGGDSLAAVRAVMALRRKLRLAIPVRLFYEHSTVASLAEQLSK